jgi:hypothetical protein
MQVSAEFSKVVRAVILSAGLLLLGFVVSDMFAPRSEVRAQNAGVVGIQAQMQPAFTSAGSTITASTHSAIFNDIGQGLNILFFCDNNFSGTVDLEWSPGNNSTFYQIVSSRYTSDTGCHTLTTGGYFPNIRATVVFGSTGIGENLSAWYTASSGPISFTAPAMGTNGPGSPISCDQNVSVSDFTATTVNAISPLRTGDTIVVCSFSYSFIAATTTGNVTLEWSAVSGCGTGVTSNWETYTLASTPQSNPVALSLRPPSSGENLCINNTSGATVLFNFSYASVQL